MNRFLLVLPLAFTWLSCPAMAHTGAAPASGLMAGFGHPMGGVDHLLAMVAVGMLAACYGGRGMWLLPLTFVSMMIAGSALGAAGFFSPLTEPAIAGSAVLLGAVIALGRQMALLPAALLVGAVAIFHGQAHGTEMPLNVSGLAYAMGFTLSTALLHAVGIALAVGVRKRGGRLASQLVRVGGGAVALAGVALTGGALAAL